MSHSATQARGQPPAETGFPPTGVALISLAILFLVGLLSQTDRTVILLVGDPLKRDLGFTDVQLSILQGAAFGLVYAAAVVPMGRLVDRRNRVRLLIASTAIWGVATIAAACASAFGVLVATRMLTGLGSSIVAPAALSLIADLFPPRHRSLSTGVFATGQSLGSAMAFIVGGAVYKAAITGHGSGPLASLAPWRLVHLAFGAPALVLCGVLLFLREPARQETLRGQAPLKIALRELWSLRAFLAPLYLGVLMISLVELGALAWAAPILIRNFDLTPPQFSSSLGVLIFVAGSGGALLGGIAAQAGRKAPWRGGVLSAAVLGAAGAVPGAFYGIAPDIASFAVLFGWLVAATVAAVITAVSSLTLAVPNELRGLAIGIYGLIVATFGLGLAPTVIALTAQSLGGPHPLGLAVALVGAPAASMAILAFLFAMRRWPAPGLPAPSTHTALLNILEKSA